MDQSDNLGETPRTYMYFFNVAEKCICYDTIY